MSDFDPVVSTVGNAFDVTTNNYSALSIINAIKTGGKNVRRGVEQIRDTIGRELDQHGDFKKAKKVSSVLK